VRKVTFVLRLVVVSVVFFSMEETTTTTTNKRKTRDTTFIGDEQNDDDFDEANKKRQQQCLLRRCDVEVRLKRAATASKEDVKRVVLAHFERKGRVRVLARQRVEIPPDDDEEEEANNYKFLKENCESIAAYFDDCEEEEEEEEDFETLKRGEGMWLMFYEVDFRVHVHEINEDGAGEEREDDEEIATYKEYALPCREFSEYWDALHFDDDTKTRLRKYAQTALEFGNLEMNASLVAFNRVVLLHGPPGTGKTTACKGLAQKLAIRMLETYSEPVLVEINAHSLFSKWFSESGKLVGKLFEKIQELTEDEDTFVFVLVDEVESLAAARRASGAEPSDAIRVVNALLTQLDALKEKKNAMVLTTSNVTEAIDVAFVDRADVKVYVGNPGYKARYSILCSSCDELTRVGLLERDRGKNADRNEDEDAINHDGDWIELLKKVTNATEGMSGRALRKLPFLTIAGMNRSMSDGPMKIEVFLEAAYDKALLEKRERENLGNTSA